MPNHLILRNGVKKMTPNECINLLVRSQDKLIETPFSVKLSEQLNKEVTEIMNEYNVSRSVVIRTLLQVGITYYKDKQS
jgi:hypothetical protein